MADVAEAARDVAAPGARRVATLHHLACTGGTIISKALAAMPSVYLVSEVHPYRSAPFQFEPQGSLAQFQAQYGALTRARLDQAFLAQVELMAEQSQEDGRTLVLRDHSHSDFNTPEPDPKPVLLALLAQGGWKVASAATVRDPLESYLSLRANGWTEGLDFDTYCQRWLQFVAAYSDLPLFCYERFAEEPDEVILDLCEALGVAYSASYASRLGLRRLTGDSGRADDAIAPRPFKEPDTLLAAEASRSGAYARIRDEWPLYRRALGASPARGAVEPSIHSSLPAGGTAFGLGPMAMRNVLMNADFSIWERGSRFKIKGWTWRYIADRWRVYLDGTDASCLALLREQPRPFGPGMPPARRYARLAFTPAHDTKSCQLYQPIEGPDLFVDEAVCLTVWLRASKPVEAAAGFWRDFGTDGSGGQSIGNNTFQPLSSKWTRYEWRVQTPRLPKGVVVAEGARLEFTLIFRVFEAVLIDVSCAQAESGIAATAFERRSPAVETLLCRRYHRKSLTRLDPEALRYEMRSRPFEHGAGPFFYDAEFDIITS